MLKIDVDGYGHKTRLMLQFILYAMPRPFFVRISSSRTGLHIAVPACEKWDWRRHVYDDPMRIDLDQQRERRYIAVNNLLWDIKNGCIAERWRAVRSERDIERFLDAIKPIYLCVDSVQ